MIYRDIRALGPLDLTEFFYSFILARLTDLHEQYGTDAGVIESVIFEEADKGYVLVGSNGKRKRHRFSVSYNSAVDCRNAVTVTMHGHSRHF